MQDNANKMPTQRNNSLNLSGNLGGSADLFRPLPCSDSFGNALRILLNAMFSRFRYSKWNVISRVGSTINESSLGLAAGFRNVDFDRFLRSVAPWGFDGRRNAPTWS